MPSVVAFAFDVSGAHYLTTVSITNNSTAVTNVSTNFTLSTANLISSGMLTANATDAVMRDGAGNDVAFQPSVNSTYPWVTWIPSIGANSQINQYLYTGNATGGTIRYFPGSGGMSVPDSPSLELSNNGTVSVSGYVDTTAEAGKYLMQKAGAVNIFVSPYVSGNITAVIDSTSAFSNVHSADSAESVYVEQSFAPAYINSVRFRALNSDAVARIVGLNEIQVWDSGTSSWVLPTTVAGGWTNPTNSVDNNTGTEATYLTNATSYSPYLTATLADAVPSTKVRWWVTDGTAMFTTKQVDVAYGIGLSITGVASGDKLITLHLDGTNAWLTVGSQSSANATVGIVPDTANPIVFAGGGSMPYMEYAKVKVSGVQQGYWSWQYATTFTDQSGNGNTATPTFSTTGTINILATISSQGPASSNSGPAANVTTGWVMHPGVPADPGVYATGAGSYPLKGELTQLAADSRTPVSAVIYFAFFLLAILVFIGVFALTHREKKGIRGSLLFASIGGKSVV